MRELLLFHQCGDNPAVTFRSSMGLGGGAVDSVDHYVQGKARTLKPSGLARWCSDYVGMNLLPTTALKQEKKLGQGVTDVIEVAQNTFCQTGRELGHDSLK